MPPLTPVTQSGTITTNGDTVTLALRPLGNGGAAIQVTGTWTGTLTFQVSADGTTFVSALATSYSSGTPGTTTTSNDTWWLNLVSVRSLRVKATASMTGTVSVFLQALQG